MISAVRYRDPALISLIPQQVRPMVTDGSMRLVVLLLAPDDQIQNFLEERLHLLEQVCLVSRLSSLDPSSSRSILFARNTRR